MGDCSASCDPADLVGDELREQSAPSGPTVIPSGPVPLARENSVMPLDVLGVAAAGLRRPILCCACSVNQSAPSGPVTILEGSPRRSESGTP